MHPEFPQCTWCEHCAAFFWVHRAREVGSFDSMAVGYDDRLFDVLLEEVGSRRLEVMMLLRTKTGLGLTDTKARLAQLPLELAGRVSVYEARELAREYETTGAKIALRLSKEQLPEAERTVPPPPEWVRAPYVPDLGEAQLFQALDEGAAETREEALYLRTRAWWAGNHPFRASHGGWIPFSERPEAARVNLEKLIGLLDEAEPLELLMKADALRELERFPEAEQTLTRSADAHWQRALDFIRELARSRIAAVRQFPTSTWMD